MEARRARILSRLVRARTQRHDAVRPTTTRRTATLIVLTLIGAVLLGAGAYAASSTPVTLKRCGYATATYGRSALYPWNMSCAAARTVVKGASNPHAHVIAFGPGFDGGAVRINGRYWVCTGQMGSYNCGFPYRPRKVNGVQGYKGPFTRDVEYVTCSVVAAGCPGSVQFTQP